MYSSTREMEFGLLGWFGHPQGLKRKKIKIKNRGLALEGGRTTPKGHGGGSATPITASGLGVASATPMFSLGWPNHPHGSATPNDFSIFFLNIYICGSDIALMWRFTWHMGQVSRS
jgi:hypothetical protein